MKKFSSAFITAIVLITSVCNVSLAAAEKEIVIIYTNDTHCAVDNSLGFADVSAIEAIEEENGNEVIILDAGDAVQGGAIGAISEGSYIIEIMNNIGYDFATPGNHEFDYKMDRLFELTEMANYPYISANLMSTENKSTVFDPYYMAKIRGKDIAFIGITTPNTISSTAPEYFKNAAGEFIYDFGGGDGFFALIQNSINEAKAEGADFVIAVTHMGTDPVDAPYTSIALIENTEGFDAVIDAHSHIVINNEIHKDKSGAEVILTSTGSKFDNIGTMRISKNGSITADLLNDTYKKDGLSAKAQAAYNKSNDFINSIKSEYATELEKIVAVTEYDLTVNNPEKYSEETGAYREVRRGETNMGNFCADAYRAVLNCDVAIINGGGVRADIKKGDVSYGDILNVNPFGNELCVIEVTGKQILDALEHGARSYPIEEGAFLQVSGLTYEIDTNVKSPVVLDDKGMFVKIDGERRVKNVNIGGKPIDENASYTLGGSGFTLINGGDGFTMFANSKVINNSVCSDCDALINYVSDFLGGTIGEEYKNPLGEGRIKIYDGSENAKTDICFTDTENHWAKNDIIRAVSSGIAQGISETEFAPDANMTRAMFVTVLYRLENSPEIKGPDTYNDISDNAYYSNAAVWANENGIMLGTDKSLFAPNEPLTREQMATAIMRYCTYKEKGPVGAWAIRLDYNDLSKVSQWAVEPLMFAKINSIMTGDDNNNFNPGATATRAEATVTILRTAEFIK